MFIKIFSWCVLVLWLITGGAPNYFPNSFSGPKDDPKYLEHMDKYTDTQVGKYNTADDDNFTQVGTYFNKVSVTSRLICPTCRK